MKGGWTGGEAGEKPAASQPLSFFFSCHHPTPLAGGHLDGAERCERTHVVETEPRTHQRELRGFPFFFKIKIKHQRKERFKCLSSNGRGIYLYFFFILRFNIRGKPSCILQGTRTEQSFPKSMAVHRCRNGETFSWRSHLGLSRERELLRPLSPPPVHFSLYFLL